jgi:predicted nucleic acid-binding Zn ribbon protein
MKQKKSKCPICSKEFKKETNHQKYCCKECKIIARKKREREYYISKKVTTAKDKSCFICGKISKTVTCSEKCRKEKIRLYNTQYVRNKRTKAREEKA